MRAWEVADYLYNRFHELGVQGMTRGYGKRLAVLHVRDQLVVWSDGRAVWWMADGALVTYPVPGPVELWRVTYARYQALTDASS